MSYSAEISSTDFDFGDGIKVNLLPHEWTRFTKVDGELQTENTIKPLSARDMFLAQQIQNEKDKLYNKYKAGEGIEIDYDNWIISQTPYKEKYSFGIGLSADSTKTISLKLNETTDLKIDGNNNLIYDIDKPLNRVCNDFTAAGYENTAKNKLEYKIEKSSKSSHYDFKSPANSAINTIVNLKNTLIYVEGGYIHKGSATSSLDLNTSSYKFFVIGDVTAAHTSSSGNISGYYSAFTFEPMNQTVPTSYDDLESSANNYPNFVKNFNTTNEAVNMVPGNNFYIWEE